MIAICDDNLQTKKYKDTIALSLGYFAKAVYSNNKFETICYGKELALS